MTHIQLVITIVVLIILAGVAINLTLGENGILNKAQQAKQKQSEQEAREKLELVLSNARIEKETNTSYNDDYLNNMLETKGITVDENYVIVDNYNYLIDREQLIILDSLGETQIKVTTEVQEYLGKNAEGKYETNLLLKVESNAGVQSVVITKPDGTTIEVGVGEVKVGKNITVELDDEYIVTITTKDGNITTRKIVEKSEETISSVTEFVAFRDAVNSGLTYEGKTVTLANDIDLSSVCGENINGAQVSWEPIGTFKGTFDGKYNKIESLYINSDKYQFSGLFGKTSQETTIKNIVMKNENITNSYDVVNTNTYAGGIVGYNNGKIENCGIDSGNIICTKTTISTSTSNYPSTIAGGIVGETGENTLILSCYNKATIIGNGVQYNVYNQTMVGGIAAQGYGSILNCYNTGKIIAKGHTATGGIIGFTVLKSPNCINNNFSLGEMEVTTTNGSYAGIIGQNNGELQNGNNYCTNLIPYSECYWNGTTVIKLERNRVEKESLKTYASTLGDAYVADGKIKNSAGEWVDNIDESGNIIYINDGYPILKWQVEE